jgi:flagellar basal-body rod protein FlgF
MDNSLLISLSHQVAAQRAMDVIANNLANMSTGGYKRESLKFEEYMKASLPASYQKGMQNIGFVRDVGTTREMAEGPLKTTGNPLDLAVSGDGYFIVQTPRGDRYTRNGHFTLNGDGQIVSADGYVLQGDGGAIAITAEDGDVRIAADGTVSGNQGQIGKIRVVDFANDRALTKEGDSLYATTQAPTDVTMPTMTQGMLETSNVEPVVEMTNMINVMRTYQAVANIITNQENLKLKAVNKLGAMPS